MGEEKKKLKKIKDPTALPISHLPKKMLPDFSQPRQLPAMTAISSCWQDRSLEQPLLQNAKGKDVNREEAGAEAGCSGWASRYGVRGQVRLLGLSQQWGCSVPESCCGPCAGSVPGAWVIICAGDAWGMCPGKH